MFFKKRKKKETKINPDKNFTASQNSNKEYNKQLWDKYARKWTKQNAYIEAVPIEDVDKENYLEYLGDEWGDKDSVKQVIEDFIFPYINSDAVVAEIGSGGGRISAKIAPKISQLTCFDISEDMLTNARKNLTNFSNIEYLLIDGQYFPKNYKYKFDFVYSFDVFVHLDLHTIWSYFKEIKKILSKSGKVFLHTTNLNAPKGWERFSKQDKYKVEGHYFVVPEIIKQLASKAGYKIIKESVIDEDNFYYKRDYLFILENSNIS